MPITKEEEKKRKSRPQLSPEEKNVKAVSEVLRMAKEVIITGQESIRLIRAEQAKILNLIEQIGHIQVDISDNRPKIIDSTVISREHDRIKKVRHEVIE